MRYTQLRLLCMFDLPTESKEEQRNYRIFRKALIENGFIMLQYSVYCRTLPNKTALKKYERAIRKKLPKYGNVRLLYVTESQYQQMQIVVGASTKQEEVVGINRLVVI